MPSVQPIRILVADDQPDIVRALNLLLSDEGFAVTPASSPAEVLELIAASGFDLALVDLNYTRDTTSGSEGYALLDRLAAVDPTLPIIVMTAWSSVAGAVEAMRRGARDYVEKPWNDERLIATLHTHVDLKRALSRSKRAEEASARQQRAQIPMLTGESPAMQRVVQIIERVAASDAGVLITGEHGTGKEVAAAWLHARSHRSSRPLVTMNAGGLAEGVAESELFGHVKGAFTDARTDRLGCFELADEGTLFLDEIGNMPLRLQAKLLRVLQTGEIQRVGSSRVLHVDVRVLSATNADLALEVAEGRFREDVLYRLNTIVLQMPPLRDRHEDLEPLARHYLAHYARRYNKRTNDFATDAWRAMRLHRWPGNVRELAHAVERAVLIADPGASAIQARDLALGAGSGGRAQDLSLDDAEKLFIEKALARHGGDVRATATQLGLSRSALYRRLQHHGLRDRP
jgi:DNA-binding NtrC family response regulator